jgi:hypothetical protein
MAKVKLEYGRYYHIYNRGNNRENLFLSSRNYRYFLRLYGQHIMPVAETFAYSLLPNHFHFSLRTRTEEEQEAYFLESLESSPILEVGPLSKSKPFKLRHPSRAFNNFFIAYARSFNNETGRTGALFESPFERKIVDNHRYLLRLITYIHRNPQAHGFVDDFRDWAWTSYGALLSDSPTKVERDGVLEWFNGRSDFADAHAIEQDEQIIAPLLLEDWF